jgi:hypothetical protein
VTTRDRCAWRGCSTAPDQAVPRALFHLLQTAAGATAGGAVCDPDPMRAVEDAVTGRGFDEIIVSTLPARLSRWLHQDLPARLGRKLHLPVTHVAAKDV